MSRADAAKEYFMKGYACAQAVLLAFSDVTGLESEIALKISLPFGGGMGRLRLTCGTVSGAVMVLGTVFSKAEINPENKKEVYAAVQEFSGRFKAETPSFRTTSAIRSFRDTTPFWAVHHSVSRSSAAKRILLCVS